MQGTLDLAAIRNPILDLRPACAVRDPAMVYEDGIFYLLHTSVNCQEAQTVTSLSASESRDLVTWTPPRLVANGPQMFCAPGNILRHGERWIACLQSYPIPPGKQWGDESSRLYLMESDDLVLWSSPRVMVAEGARVRWSSSHRQIDPYLIPHAGRFWVLYKTSGQLGLLLSDDLQHWQEASPDRPVFGSADTPDGVTVENPCVIRQGGEFLMFFSPCRPGRGIGVARSRDLLTWRDVHYLDFPALPWAPDGPTAAQIHDLRAQTGKWVMLFHGEDHRRHPHGAALGLAWSDDLEHWTVSN